MADTEERQGPLNAEAAADAPKAEATAGSRTEKGGKKTTWLIAGGGVVIVALVVVVVVLVGRLRNSNVDIGDDGVPLRNVVVNEDNLDTAVNSLWDNLTAPSSYRVKMSTTWTFRSGTSASEDAYVENAETNATDVYFDVELADTGEVIYESPILPVDSHVRNITLDKALDAGEYSCVCTYHLVDEAQNTLSTVSMGLTIVVEN